MKIEELPDGFINYEDSPLEPIIKLNNKLYYADGSTTTDIELVSSLHWESTTGKPTANQLKHKEVFNFFNKGKISMTHITAVEAAQKYLDGYDVRVDDLVTNCKVDDLHKWSDSNKYKVLQLNLKVGHPYLYNSVKVVVLHRKSNTLCAIMDKYLFDNNIEGNITWVKFTKLNPVPRTCPNATELIRKSSGIIKASELEDGQTAQIVEWSGFTYKVGTFVQRYKQSLIPIGKSSDQGWTDYYDYAKYDARCLVKLVKLKVDE